MVDILLMILISLIIIMNVCILILLFRILKTLNSMEINLINELYENCNNQQVAESNEIISTSTENANKDTRQKEEIKEPDNVFTFVEDVLTGKRDLYE